MITAAFSINEPHNHLHPFTETAYQEALRTKRHVAPSSSSTALAPTPGICRQPGCSQQKHPLHNPFSDSTNTLSQRSYIHLPPETPGSAAAKTPSAAEIEAFITNKTGYCESMSARLTPAGCARLRSRGIYMPPYCQNCPGIQHAGESVAKQEQSAVEKFTIRWLAARCEVTETIVNNARHRAKLDKPCERGEAGKVQRFLDEREMTWEDIK